MIDVLIYVTGLSLLQFTGECQPAVRVVFPAGGRMPAALHQTVTTHGVSRIARSHGASDLDLPASFDVDQGTTTACQLQAPDLPVIEKLVPDAKLRAECFGGAGQCVDRAGNSVLLGTLTLKGQWTVTEVSSCPYVQTETVPQVKPERFTPLRFVPAGTTLRPGALGAPQFTVGNGVLFRGRFAALGGFSSGIQLTANQVFSKAACEADTGLTGIADGGCVMVILDNAAQGMPKVGEPDDHFALFYDLLQEVPPTVMLPVATAEDACVALGRRTGEGQVGGTPGIKCSPTTTHLKVQ